MYIVLTLQESMLALPAHSMCSTIPPGAAPPYLSLHSLFDQIGIDTSCRTDGCGPPVMSHAKF